MVYRFSILVIAIFLVFLTPSLLRADPSVDVPVRHWSYDAIEKLAIAGLADIADIGFRPVSRIKMAYMIKSAIDKTSSGSFDFEDREQEYLEELLSMLIEEFREELVSIGVDVVSLSEGGQGKYVFNKPELHVEKVFASIDSGNTLFENREGWKLKHGINIRAALRTGTKLDNFCALSIMPAVRYSNEDTDVDVEDAHIRFSPPKHNMEFSIGRASMWWGPGFHGSLLLSSNAFPMNAVRWNNTYPFRLPWFFKRMGRFNAQMFISRLEEKRAVPNPYVTGWRIDYTPCDYLKFGFGHILMFGGKGVKRLGFSNFIGAASLVFSAAGGGTETENHIISADAQFFIRHIDSALPIATGAKLYTEWGGEDESGNVPVGLASITGIYITDVFKIPGMDVKVESAKLDKIWYEHFKYASGYTYKGNFIGHFAGGDAEDFAVAAIFNFPEKYKANFTLSRQKRGFNKPLLETTNELRIEFSLRDAMDMYNIHNIDMDMFYEFQDINNRDNEPVNDRNHIIGIEINKKF